MEGALGKKSSKSILEGNNDFFEEFSKIYGKDLLRCLGHRSTRMMTEKFQILEGADEYIEKTQNMLLSRVFDKDLEKVDSEESVKKYFEKLNQFGLLRGKKDKDDFFEKYYKEKYEEISKILVGKNISIDNLQDYEYKEPEFYPYFSTEEIMEKCQKSIPDMIGNGIYKSINEIENNKSTYLKGWKAYFSLTPQIGRENGVFLITHNDMPYSFTNFKENFAATSTNNPETIMNEKNLGIDENEEYYIEISEGEKVTLKEVPVADDLEAFQTTIESIIDKEITRRKRREEMLNSRGEHQSESTADSKKNLLDKILDKCRSKLVTANDIKKMADITNSLTKTLETTKEDDLEV